MVTKGYLHYDIHSYYARLKHIFDLLTRAVAHGHPLLPDIRQAGHMMKEAMMMRVKAAMFTILTLQGCIKPNVISVSACAQSSNTTTT